jgi:hypothetical protein
MLALLPATARATPSSGESVRSISASGLTREMCQFWQCWQWKLQPMLPNEYDRVPGRKWKRGFFSIGSIASALIFA